MPRVPATFPAILNDVAQQAELRIEALLSAEQTRWSAVDTVLTGPLDSLTALVLAGGKRLRPAFCAAGVLAAGGSLDAHGLVDAAAALELLHTFALVHDDVMDGSSTRRGMPAVHARFESEHRQQGLRGETRRFGEGIAILVGDFAFVYADVLMRAASAEAIALWDEMRIELCVGQSLDLIGAARRSTDLDFAHRIARYKSAKYTIERPLHLGAAIGGQLDALREPLSAIGIPLGSAFQMRDDILGVFGESTVTGKPVGDDLREGKPTPLLAIAAKNADAAGLALLRRVGDPELDDVEIKHLQELFETTGARREIERSIQAQVDLAKHNIADAGLGAPANDILLELSNYVAWRDA